MLNKSLAREVINLASSTGADFVEIFNEDTIRKSYMLEGLKVDATTVTTTSGIGLRLLKGTRSVYGSTSDKSKKALLELASTLSKSFDGDRVLPELDSFKEIKVKKIHKKSTPLSTVNPAEIISLLKKVSGIVLDFDKRIVRAISSFGMTFSKIEIFNSEGKHWTDYKEYGRLAIQSIASENDKIETRFDGPGAQGGWDYFTKELNVEEIAKNNAEKVILMLQAKECPSGKFPVVIGQIANTCVSAYDDGSIPNEWGSNNLDDEGNVPQKNELIKDGILTGYLVDSFNGRRMGEAGNGACRRQSYKFEPTSRMSNTYIAPGKYSKEEIIKATKLGLYAVSFNGGSVNPATGDFNFGCSEAYIIKDGKITEPVRGATLVGNARDILKHIDMVGNNLAFGQGMCGSVSGSVPVNVGQPTIRVDEIVVGGRGGSIDEF